MVIKKVRMNINNSKTHFKSPKRVPMQYSNCDIYNERSYEQINKACVPIPITHISYTCTCIIVNELVSWYRILRINLYMKSSGKTRLTEEQPVFS